MDIAENTLIGVFDGMIQQFPIRDGRLIDNTMHKFIVQIAVIGDDLLGMITPTRGGIDFINHDCEANVVARDRIMLFTARPVAAGEALCLDYTTWDLVPEGIPCWCTPSLCVL